MWYTVWPRLLFYEWLSFQKFQFNCFEGTPISFFFSLAFNENIIFSPMGSLVGESVFDRSGSAVWVFFILFNWGYSFSMHSWEEVFILSAFGVEALLTWSCVKSCWSLWSLIDGFEVLVELPIEDGSCFIWWLCTKQFLCYIYQYPPIKKLKYHMFNCLWQ